jgi:membrane protease YdiL (CAAX protease family)
MPSLRIRISAALAPLPVVLACALSAAFLAYPIFWIADDAIGFQSLVNRCGQLLLLLSAILAARFFRLDRRDIGFESKFGLFRQVASGIPLGIVMLGLHALALIALDVREIDPDTWSNAQRLGLTALKALAIGLIVATIEETMFRGVLFASLQKAAGAATASVVSALYFALLHFLRSDMKPAAADVGWTTGFRLVGDALTHLSNLDVSSFFALFLAGVFLAQIRMAFPMGLGYCIGIHAGWVCAIKTAKTATNGVPDGNWAFLIGSYDGIIGYLTAAWMSVVIVLLAVGMRRFSEGGQNTPEGLANDSH